MSIPPASEKILAAARTAQIVEYVKNNQLLTAVCLYVLWQTGAFLMAYNTVSGAVC
jgi:hypothetical protein